MVDDHSLEVPVSRVLKLLRAYENLLAQVSTAGTETDELRQLMDLLFLYKHLTIKQLRDRIEASNDHREGNFSQRMRDLIETTSINQLRNRNFLRTLTKEELAVVSNKLLGLSKSLILRTNRKDAEQLIRRAIENRDTLDTIAWHASKTIQDE